MGWVIKQDENGNRYPEYVDSNTNTDNNVSIGTHTVMEQFHKIDLQTGERLDVVLHVTELSDREGNIYIVPIPDDLKRGWSNDVVMYNPVWSFEVNDWIEGKSLDEILIPLRERKINELNENCSEVINEGFEYNGDVFQFNEKDQANFNQQLSLLLLDDTINEIQWKTENNGIKLFTRDQFIQACKTGELHKRNNIGHYWKLKHHVATYDFTSVEELNSIDFSFDPDKAV